MKTETDPEIEDMEALLAQENMTTRDLAAGSKLSRQSIYNVIRGVSDARMGTLDSIARALDVPWERVAAAFRVTRASRLVEDEA